MSIRVSLLVIASQLLACCAIAQDGGPTRDETLAAMRRAAEYYHEQVALNGGYVYYYSLDLKTRLGEGAATPTQIWVQPPGTPTVGLAYLSAYEATGDEYYLHAATHAAEALMFGQLKSGCWMHAIDFDSKGNRSGQYRNGKGRGKNYSTFDDNSSQSALLFMMKCDQAHKFNNAKIHESAMYGLDALLAAQFPNGAFPQVFEGPVSNQPVVKANYPDYDWRTENHVKEYWNFYTLNDDLAGDMKETLIAASDIYHDKRCDESLRRLGDFLILAQMPEPQPAWAQQYNFDMQPCWARKFEPPAITSHESQDVIRTLLTIYERTGDEKYLAPIPKALDYLDTCVLPDGMMARFYELKSNKPLYMTSDYQLTYDDSDTPTHYGFKQGQNLKALRAQYDALRSGKPSRSSKRSPRTLAKDATPIVAGLDAKGRWVSKVSGERLAGQPKFRDLPEYLSSEVFAKNLTTLAEYVASLK
ncbi:MAG: pectic acid lyase [Planctomycetaceae bacterium]|nr:pectic acid lyase [Planctomycetaceae bacterium]